MVVTIVAGWVIRGDGSAVAVRDVVPPGGGLAHAGRSASLTRSSGPFATLKPTVAAVDDGSCGDVRFPECDQPTTKGRSSVTDRLTSDEDQTLRNLHWLESFGAELSASLSALKAELLERDLPTSVREPAWEALRLPGAPLPQHHARLCVQCSCGWRSPVFAPGEPLPSDADAHQCHTPPPEGDRPH